MEECQEGFYNLDGICKRIHKRKHAKEQFREDLIEIIIEKTKKKSGQETTNALKIILKNE